MPSSTSLAEVSSVETDATKPLTFEQMIRLHQERRHKNPPSPPSPATARIVRMMFGELRP